MASFTWGLNKCGQLGNGNRQSSNLPCPMRLPAGHGKASQASSGGHFTCVVTDGGDVYACGCGKYGRLGRGVESEDDCLRLVRVAIPSSVRSVACGSWHACAVGGSGQLYAWGYGRAVGTLSKGSSNSTPSPVPFFSAVSVRSVSCGHNFTLVCTEDGGASSWGAGRHGVLGHGNEADKGEPARLEALSQFQIVAVDAGYAHCAAVTDTGALYTFGKAVDGALGHGVGKGRAPTCSTPTVVSKLEGVRVKAVSCSVGEHHGHTLALSDDGVVFSFGDGYKGKLGHGDQESQLVPKPIAQEHFDSPVALVVAGGIHSAAVSSGGSLFTWGCGSDGRLGHPEAEGHRYLFKSLVPRRVEGFPKGSNVTHASSSYYHMACIAQQGAEP